MSIRQRLAGAILDLDGTMAQAWGKHTGEGGALYGKLPIASGQSIRDMNELINKLPPNTTNRQFLVDQRNLGVATRVGVPLVVSTAAGLSLQQLINLLSQPQQPSGEDLFNGIEGV
mgnify:CR=1 FL=1